MKKIGCYFLILFFLMTGTAMAAESGCAPPSPPVPSASSTQAGKVELATDEEIIAGNATDRAVTPAGLAALIAHNINPAKGSDVASANNMTLGDGNIFDITGTTTINTIATKGIGTIVVLEFDGILQLTHSADLFLPTAANITTAAGDMAAFTEYASGDWRCYNYMRADGTALVGSGAADDTAYDATSWDSNTDAATKNAIRDKFEADRDFSTQNHTSTGNITEAQILANKWHTNNGASAEIDLTLPALSYTVNFIYIVQDAFISEINPPSGEPFDHDGNDLDADDCIDLSIVVGDKIAFTRILLADGSTWRWSTDTIRGVHSDTGASD